MTKKMTPFNSLTEADVRSQANGQSFDRGYRYYRSKAISNVVRRGNSFTAEIEGSGYEPYRVQLTLNDVGIETTFCSCPYDWGGICKHIVAVLLVLIHESDKIEEKPELAALLADLTAVQLRQALLGVAAAGLEFTEAVEREISWLDEQPATSDGQSGITVSVDVNAVRREIRKDFRLAGQGDPFESGYYDEYAALEMNPDLFLLPHLEKVTALLDAGDVKTAVTLITAIIDTFINGLAHLDDTIYEYNEDVFSEATLTMGASLAEVLLSLDMQPDKQEEWLAQIADWEHGLDDLDIAETAVKQGWTYPPLVAVLQGNITRKGAWEGDAPDYADELALVRLRILARQNRQQEYIYLAESEGQTRLAISMLAKSGQTDTAVAEAKEYLAYPSQMLAVAQTLAAQEAVTAALDVAAHGLTLKQESGMLELARWAREMALTAKNQQISLQAAQAAFAAGTTLADYTVVQQIAGDQWPTIKPNLLKQLSKGWDVANAIDIYLHENMLPEAMAALGQKQAFVSETDLRRVVEATRATTPDWGIGKYQERAEEIMDGGHSEAYETAVSWLQDAREIYRQHNRLPKWQHYLNSTLETHHRKYKLVPLLRNIR